MPTNDLNSFNVTVSYYSQEGAVSAFRDSKSAVKVKSIVLLVKVSRLSST